MPSPEERRETEAVHVDSGTEADISPPRGHAFPIVGIGASAGGLDAFTHLLKALPENTGMAFVLVQHLDPHHGSQLPEILSVATSMPVRTVEDGMHVRPDEVFVIPPNTTMILEDGVLRLDDRKPGLHLPIDAFFESLARVQGGRAIAIVLSGNASDGSQGVKAVKAECGLTFAQDEASAQHIGMPRNAIATGAVDYVLSPPEIARELVHLSQHPFVLAPQPSEPGEEILPDGNGELKKIFRSLRLSTKVDFSHYKRNTIRRRIGRRMIVNRVRNLAEYADLLQERSDEVRELYRDLLISVTNFFRDPGVFTVLTHLLKDLIASRDPSEPFRVWVPGCATGEEAYSLAICLKELLDDMELTTPIQLFATDISDSGLDRARSGTYPDLISQDVSPERLRRFFVRVDRGFQISKAIRESCVFARQDVIDDPPFAHTDLISCRNLLIYLDSALQRKVLPVFHYSLNPTGLLLLGNAESIAAASDLFSVIDKQHRIYGRKPGPARLTLNLAPDGDREKADPVKMRTTLTSIELQKKADLLIQNKYAPAAVVVDSDLRILHFRGQTGFYLEPAHGEATLSLLRMTREGLTTPLRKALKIAAERKSPVRETGITVENRGERREINLEVTPIAGTAPGEGYYLIVFEEAPVKVAATGPAVKTLKEVKLPQEATTPKGQVRELQQQVGEMRESLRVTKEEHEAHSEELRAANEEVRSANEELQSTNEELSTTKEELQSANEELTTLNEELQNRNQESNTLNSDLLNLLSAVDIPFLMVDNQLRLRRFSVAAEKVLDLKPMDIGHPVIHIQRRIDLTGFGPPILSVVETLGMKQWDLQDGDGRWYSATIRPYRTADDRITGAVIVFVDIDPLKRTLRAAEQARDYAEGMIETVREPLLVLNGDLRIQRATPAFYETFRVSRSETEGRLLYDIGNGQWNIPHLRELLGTALFRNESFHDFEIERDFPHLGRRTMRLNARRISRDSDDHRTVLLAIEDVTQRREEAEVRYQRLFETAKDGMLLFDAETEKLTDVNPYFLELTGYGRERLIGCRLSEMEVFRDTSEATRIVNEARFHEVVRHEDVGLIAIDGRRIEAELVANRYPVGGQQVVQVNVRDVTKRNRAVQDLRESEERFRLLVDSVRDYALFQMDPGGRITSWNSGAERLLGYSETEIIGQSAVRLFTPEDAAQGEATRELETARTTGGADNERWHIRKDGSRFFASGVVTTVRDQAGRLRGFAKVMRDITERKKAEEQLKQQAQLLELAQDIIIVRGLDGRISFWNDAASAAYGWSGEEAVGKISYELLQTVFPEPLSNIQAVLLTKNRWEGELLQTRRDGAQITVWSRWALQFDSLGKPVGVLVINSDITARKRADEQLRASLREKEVLLKEIHHRVKNNLQVIASLLSLQSEHIADSKVLAMLEEMNNRVRSIAAIHEMLYGSADLSRIDFASYLNTIAKDLMSFFSDRAGKVRVQVDAAPISLDITKAAPCGLIVNELMTNSFKHAFPDDRQGVITVSLRCPEEECVLEIADNGVGMPAALDPRSATSMGLQLLGLLVQQLKGKLEIDRTSGTRFTITFSAKPAA
jgi:two-component system, chemotaxis family, CheB/CheR fusion protein